MREHDSGRACGRKRTPDGVLVEVRVVGADGTPDDELTCYVHALLARAGEVCASLAVRRALIEERTRKLRAVES